jgi:hypothetical protein
MKKIVPSVTLILILASVIFGVITRNSFKDGFAGANFDSFTLVPMDVFNVSQQDIVDRLDTADTILKVRFTGERELAYLCTRSVVEVLETYKGAKSLVGNKIAIYEVPTWDPASHSCRNFIFFNLMIPGKEYYVFLYAKHYLTAYQDMIQYPEFRCASGDFAVLPVQDELVFLLDKNKVYTYGEIKDIPIFATTESEYQSIIKLKYEMIERYHVGS